MPSINTFSPQQAQLFNEIQDIIGSFHLWPNTIQNWFLHGVPRGRGQRLRPILAVFFLINGLNPIVVIEWCRLCPNDFTQRAIEHLQYLFNSFEQGYLQYIYGYNVTLGHYQTLNGAFHNARRPA